MAESRYADVVRTGEVKDVATASVRGSVCTWRITAVPQASHFSATKGRTGLSNRYRCLKGPECLEGSVVAVSQDCMRFSFDREGRPKKEVITP
jgi:hypothetical protein